MCGRFVNFLKERETVEAFSIVEVTDRARLLPPSWNIAPTQDARIVSLDDEGRRRLEAARWGLVPSWAKDPSMGLRLFNARSETVDSKPAFRSAFVRRRCLVPANGYYEWQRTPEGKHPHFIHPADHQPVAFAGLWETWGKTEDPLLTFTILTTEAEGDLALIHRRRPVMLTSDAGDAWLDPGTSSPELAAVLRSDPPPIVATPVSRDVGNVRINHSGLVEPEA